MPRSRNAVYVAHAVVAHSYNIHQASASTFDELPNFALQLCDQKPRTHACDSSCIGAHDYIMIIGFRVQAHKQFRQYQHYDWNTHLAVQPCLCLLC